MNRTLIQNALVVDPANDLADLRDILIEGDTITGLAPKLPLPQGAQAEVIDAGGAVVTPGFVDLQVNPSRGIEPMTRTLLSSGVTTPLIMSCNVLGASFLQHYGSLENAVAAADGQYTNVATAVSIQPEDTELHETYRELRVPTGSVEARVREFDRLGIAAVGEVVLPLAGVAHVTSKLCEPFLDELLDVTTRYGYPVFLHTGMGTEGLLRPIRIANGRPLHICHVGSTIGDEDLYSVLRAIRDSPNITCDTTLTPLAGTSSRKSALLQRYFQRGEAYHVDPETLVATPYTDLESASPPYYYDKENLLENNIICAMSGAVDAVESDDMGDGVCSRITLQNVLLLLRSARTGSSRRKLLLSLIGKMTHRPAAILKLDRRGSIAEGQFADLVLFDREMTGVDTVFVNGQAALRGGTVTGVKAGRHLARIPG